MQKPAMEWPNFQCREGEGVNGAKDICVKKEEKTEGKE